MSLSRILVLLFLSFMLPASLDIRVEAQAVDRKLVTACLAKAEGKPSFCLPRDLAYNAAKAECLPTIKDAKNFEDCLSRLYVYNSFIHGFDRIFGKTGKPVHDRCNELNAFAYGKASCLKEALGTALDHPTDEALAAIAQNARAITLSQEQADVESLFPVNLFWNGLFVPYRP